MKNCSNFNKECINPILIQPKKKRTISIQPRLHKANFAQQMDNRNPQNSQTIFTTSGKIDGRSFFKILSWTRHFCYVVAFVDDLREHLVCQK
jgi:hypothetical protein